MGKLRIAFLVFLGLPACAQPLSLNTYLKSALNHAEYKGYESRQQYLADETAYRLPWVNELSFRTRNNELLGYKQQYALRVDAGNPWQIKRNNVYFKGQHDLLGLERALLLKEILADRYEWAIDVIAAGAEWELTLKERNLAGQLAETWKQKSGSPSFDSDRFLEAQLRWIEISGAVLEKELDVEEAKHRVAVSVNTTQLVEWDTNLLITVEEIEKFIQLQAVGEPMHLKVLKQKLLVAEQKLKVEQANFDIGFLQAMYVPQAKDDVGFIVPRDRPLGLSLGVNIPIVKPNKDNIARSQLNLLEAKADLVEAEGSTVGATLAHRLLVAQLKSYKSLHSLVADFVAEDIHRLVGVAKNYDPVIELEYQLKLIDLQKQEIRLKSKILRQFISWLSEADLLQKAPLVNYLHPGMPSIQD